MYWNFVAIDGVIKNQLDINSAKETVLENINVSAKKNIGYYEMMKQKPFFDEGCSKSFNQRTRNEWV
jgi:hypothetical protein